VKAEHVISLRHSEAGWGCGMECAYLPSGRAFIQPRCPVDFMLDRQRNAGEQDIQTTTVLEQSEESHSRTAAVDLRPDRSTMAALPFRDINVHASATHYAFTSPSTPSAPTLVVDRPTGDLRLNDGGLLGGKRVSSIAGILGMIRLRLGKDSLKSQLPQR
jgi:hypothetical protein